jgi:hypothetical protein
MIFDTIKVSLYGVLLSYFNIYKFFRNSACHGAQHSFFNIKLQIIISFQYVILLKLRSLTYKNIKVLELVLAVWESLFLTPLVYAVFLI